MFERKHDKLALVPVFVGRVATSLLIVGAGGIFAGFRSEEERARQGSGDKGHLQPSFVIEFSLSQDAATRCIAVFAPRGHRDTPGR
jgi:hypothetical protein